MTYPDTTPVYTRTEVGIPPGGKQIKLPPTSSEREAGPVLLNVFFS
jgi:hypothetical protein